MHLLANILQRYVVKKNVNFIIYCALKCTMICQDQKVLKKYNIISFICHC